jgi:ABC-type glutathione transport system ATPase component
MNKGRIIEQGDCETVLTAPGDRYTQQLLSAISRPSMRGKRLMSRTEREAESPPAALPPLVMTMDKPVLRFERIRVRYKRPDGSQFDAVNGVSLQVNQGEILGIVGESGSGKSTLAKTAVGLVSPASGQVFLEDDPLDWSAPKMQWRRDIQYIFQDPRGALDPSARILNQVRLPLDVHRIGDRAERNAFARTLMRQTSLDEALFTRKPGSLSGGQRQRATIARALTLHPKLLICDECVSALDVSTQARVLDLLMDLREKFSIAILFISHDLSVIHHLCDRVVVMRHGELIEEGETGTLFSQPVAAYTKDLIAAIPPLPEQIGVNAAVAGGAV